MKTLILTGCDKSMYDVLDLTIPSKQKYAAKHGYDFMSVRSFPGDAECGLEERHIGFQRTVLAFKLLRHYESVMWVDADSVITMTLDLNNLIISVRLAPNQTCLDFYYLKF